MAKKKNNSSNAPRFLSGSEALARTAVGQRAASQPVFSEGSRQSQVGAQNYRAPAPAAPKAQPQAQAPAPAAQAQQPVAYGRVTSNSNNPNSRVETYSNAPIPVAQQAEAVPEFDWDAWNAEMAAQQSAIWESMDAMNSAFLVQQAQWQERMASRPSQGSIVNGSTDSAMVRRKKKSKSKTAAATNTTIGSSSSGGVSLGGAKNGNNGLSIGKA